MVDVHVNARKLYLACGTDCNTAIGSWVFPRERELTGREPEGLSEDEIVGATAAAFVADERRN